MAVLQAVVVILCAALYVVFWLLLLLLLVQVPAAALLRYLSVETAKWPLLKELEVPQPLVLFASRLVPQSASECTVRLQKLQHKQQENQKQHQQKP